MEVFCESCGLLDTLYLQFLHLSQYVIATCMCGKHVIIRGEKLQDNPLMLSVRLYITLNWYQTRFVTEVTDLYYGETQTGLFLLFTYGR